MTGNSPIVEEVRQRAMEISARFDHDLRRYYEHIRELQAKHSSRLVNQITIVRTPPKAAGTR